MRLTVRAKSGKFFTSERVDKSVEDSVGEFLRSDTGNLAFRTSDGKVVGFKDYDYVEFEED